MIDFSHVTKVFPTGETVLDDITFTVNPGEFVVLTGKSGVGKTTIGRLLIRDLLPTKGKIEVDGEDLSQIKNKEIPKLRQKIGFVFQDYKIIPDKTVGENIRYVLEIAGIDKAEIPIKVEKLLKLVDIPNKGDLFPLQLSGGELQRASIARAIAAKPPILFADEPTGNLDKDTSMEIFELLRKINELGTTVIMATHDVAIISFDHTRHLHLDNGRITKDKDGQEKRSVEKEPEEKPKDESPKQDHHPKKKTKKPKTKKTKRPSLK